MTITVGVRPLSANNRVEVYYRVNGGAAARIAAQLVRTDPRAQSQYFSARFPSFNAGDTVDYGPVCSCSGKQIPASATPAVFPSTFRVVNGQPQTATGYHAAALSQSAASPRPTTPSPAGTPYTSTASNAGGNDPTIEGLVSSPGRGGLPGLRVEIVDKNAGPHVAMAATVSDAHGHYQVTFQTPPNKPNPDLAARVYAGQTLLASSAVRYNAGPHEILDVVVPAGTTGLPSEYEALHAALAHHTGNIGDLQEGDEREDITYLAQKTGWDARAIAMAVLAEQLSRQGAGKASGAKGLDPAFYYALFRAGFPTDADALYEIPAAVAEDVWKQAIADNVIPRSLEGSIATARKTFEALSAAHILDAKPATGLSSMKEILQSRLGSDASRLQTFADLYARYKDDLSAFWSNLEKAFGAELTKQLQFDGQLGHLTLNNAPLIAALHKAETGSLTSVHDLVQRGYYEPAKWLPLIGTAVPQEIAGDTIDNRRSAYAEYLAAQIRVASPTGVIAHRVHSGALPVSDGPDVKDGLRSFLAAHSGKFELGEEPIDRYLARNQLSGKVAAPVVTHIKRLQRLYQITPDDHALQALLAHNLDSAYAITRYDADGFVRAFGQAVGGEAIARQIYAKATLVHGAVLQVAMSHLAARGTPALGGGVAGGFSLSAAPTGHQATLDQLFGSMDFCACAECRSILSPAAYMVDLLNFIDYPPAGAKNPQVVLLERRPDLQYLPLTCENTNTALPYIDLVNETLEYFVANRMSLDRYQGHTTTAAVTSEELMASPQFVSDAAYATLQTALFPSPLPFDRPLELLRLHLGALDLPLHRVMATLHGKGSTYSWRDILWERIGLSRAEYRLLTDSTLTLHQLFGIADSDRVEVSPLPPQAPADQGMHRGRHDDAIARLSSFRELCRRTRVSYEELTSILRTRFINPSSGIMSRLESLKVPFSTIQALKLGAISDAAFEALLPPGLDPVGYGGAADAPRDDYRPIVAWLKNDAIYPRIMGIVTVAAPADDSDTCSADKLQLRYSDPDPAHNTLREIEFVRLNRFIRLWRKLGLTIEQTDAIVSALYPATPTPAGASKAGNPKQLDEGFSTLLVRIGFLLQTIELLSLKPQRDLLPLLGCWAPIDTSGKRSLYRKMFLNPMVLHQDPAFAESQDGSVLQDSAQKLWDHEPALCAALNLTGAELALIAGALVPDDSGSGHMVIPGALGFDATTPLTLDNVSAIHRRGWLARTLRLSVVELLTLIEVTGLDPFAPLDLAASAPVEPPAIRFIRLVQALRAASIKPVQALYLLWNRDLSGKSAPRDSQIVALARTLRADFAAVESQFALVADPNGDIARGLMTLVYGADATGFFFALLDNKLVVTVPYAHPQPTLPPPVVDAAAGRLSYDHFRKQLAFSGVLDDRATLPALNTAAAGTAPLLAAIAALSKANHRVVDPFFAAHPKLPAAYAAYAASKDPPETRRTALLAVILPDLKQSRKREQALATIPAATGVDPTFASALLLDANVLQAAVDPTRAGIADVIAIEAHGLSAQFFFGNDPTASPDGAVDAVASLAYAPGSDNPLPPSRTGGPIAAVWSGFVDAPKSDFYDLQIATDPGSTVTLEVNGASVAIAQSAGVWSNTDPISLKAGVLSAIRLTVTAVKDRVSVTWQTATVGAQPIPAACLYSATLVARLRTTYLRFLKAASLGGALGLTADEIAYLAASAELAVDQRGWLNSLATSGTPSAPTAARLGEVLVAVLDFARIKAALSPADGRFLAVLKDPTRALANGDGALDSTTGKRESMLLGLTRWAQDSLSALLMHFFGDAQLSHLSRIDGFRCIHDAYAVVTASGVSAAPLLAAITNDPTPTAAGQLEAALRARHAAADWLTVVKPINDKMRTLQRDALVAFVLHHLGEHPATRHIDTPDKLFEYFLMDVEMAPCSATSRIRLALSSIQLFIERALRGLEPEIDPSHIRADEWEWMKRYRVWQANREVFLWPENWLDPDLRTDASAFFKETMSELLQGDITEDRAATAYLNYLTKLEDVAKLEPCGIHQFTGEPGTADDVVHVVARTAGAKRKHYYRRQETGSWTPWEEIKLDIEDHPVVPVVWNHRLLLLWLRILKQAPIDPSAQSSNPNATPEHGKKLTEITLGGLQTATRSGVDQQTQVTIQAVLCWSERYNGTWQATKTADVNAPITIGKFAAAGPRAFDRSRLRLRAATFRDGRLVVNIVLDGSPVEYSAGFILYNTHSVPDWFDRVGASAVPLLSSHRAVAQHGADFTITYLGHGEAPKHLIKAPLPGRSVEPQPGPTTPRDAPFLFEDTRHVFYVTTEEEPHALLTFQGFGHGRTVPALHPGTVHVFARIVTPHDPHPPPPASHPAHTVRFGAHPIGHTGTIRSAHLLHELGHRVVEA